MSFAWNTHKVAEILSLKPSLQNFRIQNITLDSRQVQKGSLFIAIKGDTHDGHEFIEKAIQAGAAAVVSEKKITEGSDSCEVFQVPSSLDAIRTLAYSYRKSHSIPFIAVVGAVGKTTTKEIISSLLEGKFAHVLKTEGSQNGFLGIPLTLLRLKPETEVAVIEIGIDEIGAMEKHLNLVEPTHAILTKIGPEHLHQLKTIDIAAEEELKAFDYGLAHKVPLAVNLSDEYVFNWFQKNRSRLDPKLYVTYSMSPSDRAQILGSYSLDQNQLTVETHIGGVIEDERFSTPLPGVHHALNLLAALSMCRFFKLSTEELHQGLSTFKTAYGRTEIYHLENEIDVIGDHYNSNPTSLLAAITLLTSKKGAPHYHAALGDMLELGDAEEQFHREIAPKILSSGVTHVWLYGDRMKWLRDELNQLKFKNVQHFDSHKALTQNLKKSLSPKDQILVKGSRGMKMESVLKSLIGSAQAV